MDRLGDGPVKMARKLRAALHSVGLTEQDYYDLARYNGERARGIVHSAEWQTRMAALQARYNQMESW